MDFFQNQVVFFGATEGVISDVQDETVNVHLIDGRYYLGVMKDTIRFNPVWTLKSCIASYSRVHEFILESEKILNKYTVKYELYGKARFGVFIGEDIKSIEKELNLKGYKILDLKRSNEQILKEVIYKSKV